MTETYKRLQFVYKWVNYWEENRNDCSELEAIYYKEAGKSHLEHDINPIFKKSDLELAAYKGELLDKLLGIMADNQKRGYVYPSKSDLPSDKGIFDLIKSDDFLYHPKSEPSWTGKMFMTNWDSDIVPFLNEKFNEWYDDQQYGFGRSHCSCEWDCCGCEIGRGLTAYDIAGSVMIVEGVSRNY